MGGSPAPQPQLLPVLSDLGVWGSTLRKPGREDSWVLVCSVGKVTWRQFLPPASPSLEPLDGCVSTDSELIKSYLSSAVDTEPSRLACSGMRVFLRAYRKWLAQTPGYAHPCPPPPASALGPPPQPPMGPAGWWGVAGESGPGAGWAQRLLISPGPLPSSWVPGAGRFGQEESGEVIITCLSYSRDVQHLANRKYR